MNKHKSISIPVVHDTIIKGPRQILINNLTLLSRQPKPDMYLAIFGLWILALLWFQPRLLALLDISYSPASYTVLLLFILFIDFAWLYGIFNFVVIIFGIIYNKFYSKPEDVLANLRLRNYPEVAILYTTCNDFKESSVQSCVDQDYDNFTVYILDDSSQSCFIEKVDRFAAKHQGKVKVVRRPDRKAFKAGNMNYGLRHVATEEPYFAIADADEILPKDFLKKLVPVIESDDKCGFVQANHQCNPDDPSTLAQAMGVGIDIHWEYYQPLRNEFGFVMFLGHGALLRRSCWESIGGFPHIVSEDLGFAIDIREKGFRGRFVRDVVCFEDFPDSIRSFRVRHMKWTRGTCEFLHKRMITLVKGKNITWTEKLDILFPTLNLPLTLLYFGFMIIANLGIPYYYGQSQILTLELGLIQPTIPIMTLHEGFESIYTLDFFAITLLTFFSPVLCFIVALYRHPMKLLKFISHSTSLYAALGPLSSIGVLSYLISGKAIFLVTGDKNQQDGNKVLTSSFKIPGLRERLRALINRSHPDTSLVQGLEIFTGIIFSIACLYLMQISFFGLCLAFMFMPLMHKIGWNHRISKLLIHLPFLFISIGLCLAGLSLVGMQTVFFGYGFHF